MPSSTFCRTAALGLVLLAGLSATGCETDPSDRIIAFDLRGAVRVILFRDENFSFNLNLNFDSPVPQARVILLRSATRADSTHLFTDSSGIVLFEPVDVGQYRIDLAPNVLGDSLLRIDPDRTFTVPRGDTVLVAVGVRFPSHSISEARSLPIGKKVYVRGMMLNVQNTFGDSTVHIADSVASIRMSRVRPFPGGEEDSVQFLGVRAIRDGQPTFNLTASQMFALRGSGDPLLPDSIRTNVAAAADGGKQDANLVRVFVATIADTLTGPDGKTFNLNDGSGPLHVLLDNNINFGNQAQLNRYAPGVKVTVAGLLVPNPLATGSWMLKPRRPADITILP